MIILVQELQNGQNISYLFLSTRKQNVMVAVHIPCSEDFPLTPTIGNQATLFIKPFNYFDENPSMASANNVYITKTKSKSVIKTNNTLKEPTCGIPERNIY